MQRARDWWRGFRREPAAAALDPGLRQALAADAPAVDIAPNDPLIAYLQGAAGAVDVASLQLDSPALAGLRAAGITMVVPLVSQGELIGLLNLGERRSEQAYSADDRKLLNDLAGQVAPAVRVAQLARQQQEEARERERIDQELRVAQLIQQQFLPRELPDLPGWQVTAYYQPARAVGGDFYDFIQLAGGQTAIVVGDVTDKGVPAALVMATTHAILRAEAPRLVAPAEVLERANELLVEQMPAHMFVTCLYALLDPASGELRFANAGHNLPYLRAEGGVAELRATGMPLGLLAGMRYEERTATLGPGDVLLLHSDGLAEAHSPGGEMFGFPRLAKLVGDHQDDEGLIDLLLGELGRFTGPGWEQEDDITLVTLRCAGTASGAARILAGAVDEGSGLRDRDTAVAEPAGEEDAVAGAERLLTEFQVQSVPGNERLAIDGVVGAVRDLALPPARLERLRTAVGEATMNAIEHGNLNRPELPVEIRVSTSAEGLVVRVTDHGGGRSIPEPETPDLAAKLAGEQSPRGWGLYLIKHMVDELRTSAGERHHTVELVMHLEQGAPDGRGG
jgi:serine phosphatase RsbU (regulator of sigma subunit)/anti-sigma regulatory factor (Ser/Thr protein kinase)